MKPESRVVGVRLPLASVDLLTIIAKERGYRNVSGVVRRAIETFCSEYQGNQKKC